MRYRIEFFTDWHCGSGLSSGADLDLLVIKDKDGLPFIPGKTIKGLVREAVEDIIDSLSPRETVYTANMPNAITAVFGREVNAKKEPDKMGYQGCAFFTNAELSADLRKVIVEKGLQEHLYRSVASTAIDDEGIAVKHSLRKMEVTVPCTLEGEILDVPKNFTETMERGLKFIKRLGQNRNRGLGRCSISIIKEGGSK
jgi:CRISPR/Cas system CSM-associated protein Csm3 (group 7 of RAMP superfamily)